MNKTVNILGDTPKEQWLNAINIYELCICENARNVAENLPDVCNIDEERCWRSGCDPDWEECRMCESLDIVRRQGKAFADEMRRLVEEVME